jgi:hypothetical protein
MDLGVREGFAEEMPEAEARTIDLVVSISWFMGPSGGWS